MLRSSIVYARARGARPGRGSPPVAARAQLGAPLSLLVNDEHTLAKLESCGLDTALGVQILCPMLFEVLVGFGKLAGGERFTSARFHYDSHSASSFFEEPTGSPYRLIGSANGYSLRKVAVGRAGRHARTSWNTPSVCSAVNKGQKKGRSITPQPSRACLTYDTSSL